MYRQIKQHKLQIEKEIREYERIIKDAPRGKLIYTKNGQYTKWYKREGNELTYIPKKNRELASELAKKGLASDIIKGLKSEKYACELYLRHHKDSMMEVFDEYASKGIIEDLLPNCFEQKSEIARNWMNGPYPQNTAYKSDLIHKSVSGHILRSKSEMIIDTLLYKNGLAFRYECELNLGGTLIYPDFTIYDFSFDRFIYWEHFGLIDNPTYFKNFLNKLQLYAANGIYPGVNLIMTFETADHPLSYGEVENIIEQMINNSIL